MALRATQYGLLFLGNVVVTRALGATGRAQYALAIALATIAWVVVHLSLEGAGARMLARGQISFVRAARLLSTGVVILGSTGTLLSLAAGLSLREEFLGGATETAIVLASLTIPFTLAGQMAAALLFRLGDLQVYGRVVAFSALLQTFTFVAVWATDGLSAESAVAIALFSIAATAAGLLIALARRLGSGALVPSFRAREIKDALRIGLTLHPASLALYLNLKVDLLLVAAISGAEQAGLYSLSVTLVDVLFVAVNSMTLGTLQVQTRENIKDAAEYTMDFIRQNVGLTTLIAAVAAGGSWPFISLVYGEEWSGSVLPFAILCLALIGLSAEEPARGLLMRLEKPFMISMAALAGFATNVGLNLALVPSLGIEGSALASLVSYWLVAAFMVLMLRDRSSVSLRRAFSLPLPEDPVRALPRAMWSARLNLPGIPRK